MLIASPLRALLWCGLVPGLSGPGLADQTNFSFYLLILPWSSVPFFLPLLPHFFPSFLFFFTSPPPPFFFPTRSSLSERKTLSPSVKVVVPVSELCWAKVLRISSLLMLMPRGVCCSVGGRDGNAKRHGAWPNRNYRMGGEGKGICIHREETKY